MTRPNRAEYNKAYRAANLEKIKERKRAYYLANKEKINEKNRAYHQANKERLNEQSRAYHQANAERLNAKHREYWQENAERLREKCRKWGAANKTRRKEYLKTNKEKLLPKIIEYQTAYYVANRESLLQARRDYIQRFPEKLAAQSAKRKAARSQRTPSWLTKEDLQTIESFYLQARQLSEETGQRYHVDHIIPLRGKKVSGLHVPSNLRVIPASENIRKFNKFEV